MLTTALCNFSICWSLVWYVANSHVSNWVVYSVALVFVIGVATIISVLIIGDTQYHDKDGTFIPYLFTFNIAHVICAAVVAGSMGVTDHMVNIIDYCIILLAIAPIAGDFVSMFLKVDKKSS